MKPKKGARSSHRIHSGPSVVSVTFFLQGILTNLFLPQLPLGFAVGVHQPLLLSLEDIQTNPSCLQI
jgi:hypothetical protein